MQGKLAGLHELAERESKTTSWAHCGRPRMGPKISACGEAEERVTNAVIVNMDVIVDVVVMSVVGYIVEEELEDWVGSAVLLISEVDEL